jgi:hypothetical protein
MHPVATYGPKVGRGMPQSVANRERRLFSVCAEGSIPWRGHSERSHLNRGEAGKF